MVPMLWLANIVVPTYSIHPFPGASRNDSEEEKRSGTHEEVSAGQGELPEVASLTLHHFSEH